MSDNPNTNCLIGFQCPECGSFGPFHIEVTTMMLVHDDGSDFHGDIDYQAESRCTCDDCGTDGTVNDFLGGRSQ